MGQGREVIGSGNVMGLGSEVNGLLRECDVIGGQLNEARLGSKQMGRLIERAKEAGLGTNQMGHSVGLQKVGQNREKFRIGTQPVWRVKEGEVEPSTSGSQSTSPEKVPRYPSDLQLTHQTREKVTMVSRSSTTATEDLREGDEEAEASRTFMSQSTHWDCMWPRNH